MKDIKEKQVRKINCKECGDVVEAKLNQPVCTIICDKCKEKMSKHICDKCKKPFVRYITKSKLNKKHFCDDCKTTNSIKRRKEKKKNVIFFSKRKIKFLLTNSETEIKCSICNWNESTCDIHHIISTSKCGTDSAENLIIVCPNCHRVIHKTKKYSVSFLKKKSIFFMYPQLTFFTKIKTKEVESLPINNQYANDKIKLIFESKIDFSKLGWVKQVSKILNISPQKVNKWMKKYMFDFYNEKCFKRKFTNVSQHDRPCDKSKGH